MSAVEILPLAVSRCEALLSANNRLRDCLHALKQIDDETIIKYVTGLWPHRPQGHHLALTARHPLPLLYGLPVFPCTHVCTRLFIIPPCGAVPPTKDSS